MQFISYCIALTFSCFVGYMQNSTFCTIKCFFMAEFFSIVFVFCLLVLYKNVVLYKYEKNLTYVFKFKKS